MQASTFILLLFINSFVGAQDIIGFWSKIDGSQEINIQSDGLFDERYKMIDGKSAVIIGGCLGEWNFNEGIFNYRYTEELTLDSTSWLPIKEEYDTNWKSLEVSVKIDSLTGDTLMKWYPINYTYKKIPANFTIPDIFASSTIQIVNADDSLEKKRGVKYSKLLLYKNNLFNINGSKQIR